MPSPVYDSSRAFINFDEINTQIETETAIVESLNQVRNDSITAAVAANTLARENIVAALNPDLEPDLMGDIESALLELDEFEEVSDVDDKFNELTLLTEKFNSLGFMDKWGGHQYRNASGDPIFEKQNIWDDEEMMNNWKTYKEMMWRGGSAVSHPFHMSQGLGLREDWVEEIGGSVALDAFNNMKKRKEYLNQEARDTWNQREELKKELYPKEELIGAPGYARIISSMPVPSDEMKKWNEKQGAIDEAVEYYKQAFPKSDIDTEAILQRLKDQTSLDEIEKLNDLYKTQASLDFIQSNV